MSTIRYVFMVFDGHIEVSGGGSLYQIPVRFPGIPMLSSRRMATGTVPAGGKGLTRTPLL
jgi:hypothetical protein